MVTVITDTGHVTERVARELTPVKQILVTAMLAAHGIHVEAVIDVFNVLHVWALRPATTRQEVEALAAFRAVTDARLVWHPAAEAEPAGRAVEAVTGRG
jgi:hypothetical protein